MREPTTEESWLDTWISGCQENMNQCSGCLIDEKECQTAYDAISRRLEKPEPTVSREFVQRFFPCQCDPAYKGRGLTMPGCPYHDTGWEEMLTELGFEVGDNSEVGRRTSDKEGV